LDYGLGFLGEYITAAELVGKTPTLTIGKVTLEKVESLKGDEDGAGKLKDRGWLLNRTNAEALKEMWGRETNEWIGHKVTLFVVNVRVGKKMEPGIRVKGSPELTSPKTFELKLPRKKPIATTLLPTGKPSTAPAPEPEQVDSDTGEITSDYTPTVADALALVESGQIDEAQDMARSLGEEDAAQVFNAVQKVAGRRRNNQRTARPHVRAQ
jgi:hypothetical protein